MGEDSVSSSTAEASRSSVNSALVSFVKRYNPLKSIGVVLVVRKLPPPKRKPILPRRALGKRVAEQVVVDQAGLTDFDGQHGQPAPRPEVVGVDELGVVGPGQRLRGEPPGPEPLQPPPVMPSLPGGARRPPPG